MQVAPWLSEDSGAPFGKDVIDDSLLIDGELVQNPRQGESEGTGTSASWGEALEEAFP